jgi:hypothetical protein
LRRRRNDEANEEKRKLRRDSSESRTTENRLRRAGKRSFSQVGPRAETTDGGARVRRPNGGAFNNADVNAANLAATLLKREIWANVDGAVEEEIAAKSTSFLYFNRKGAKRE